MAADQGIRTPKTGSCETAQMGDSGNRFPGTEMPQRTSSGSPRPGAPQISPRTPGSNQGPGDADFVSGTLSTAVRGYVFGYDFPRSPFIFLK